MLSLPQEAQAKNGLIQSTHKLFKVVGMGLVRLVFIFVGATIALLFWQRISKKQGRQHIDPMQEDPRLGRLIPCAACGTYVDQKTAYSKRHHSKKGFFCDAACAKVGFAKQSKRV